MAEPTKQVKQTAPNRIMRFAVLRMVMPKTIDTESANSRTAVKWEGLNIIASCP
jgi:hypothetical protein